VKRVRIRVRGFVQGVGFRFELRDRAQTRAVSGWVRNNPDGSVEAVLEGPAEAVDSLVDWCRRGPRGASVEDIEMSDEQPVGEPAFAIR
jgi:acylphosphatase